MILARVPIYGTQDAGRLFWKQFKEVIERSGFRKNNTFKAWYTLNNEQDLPICILGTHVDDMMWAALPEADQAVQSILDAFDCRKVETHEFRFCGQEVKQPQGQFTVKVTCKDTSEKIENVKYMKTRKQRPTEQASESEKTQIRSVNELLEWICFSEIRKTATQGPIISHATGTHNMAR